MNWAYAAKRGSSFVVAVMVLRSFVINSGFVESSPEDPPRSLQYNWNSD